MNKYYRLGLLLIGILLGGFFIYKGLNKHFLSPCKTFDPDSTIPLDYQHVITAFCQSGFSKVVGGLQILSGILLLIPRTRLFGAIMLLPIIANIFLIHLFLDNRFDELVETGIPLAMTILIITMSSKNWRGIFNPL